MMLLKDFIKEHRVLINTPRGVEKVEDVKQIDDRLMDSFAISQLSGRVYLASTGDFAIIYTGYGDWLVEYTNGDFINFVVREDKNIFVLTGHDGAKVYDLGAVK